MLISSPAFILKFPDVVDPSARMFFVVEILAARLLKSLSALIETDPPLIEAFCKRVEVILPVVVGD